jgi:hypothetical protein
VSALDTTITRSVEVRLAPEEAFALFTERASTWWPFATHSVAGDAAESAVFEPPVGGRVYERARDGSEHDWGEITVWDPPRRFALAWTLDPACAGTEVEVRFAAVAGGTRVELEHHGWENASREVVEGYAGGWEHVLRTFAGASG